MTDTNHAATSTAEPAASGLVITRVFDAPRDLVFKAYSEAERLAQWWGPKGFTMRVLRFEFRPGGVFHYSQQAPGGDEMYGKFVYREIESPERIVFVSSFADAEGNVTRNPWSAEWPLEVLNVLSLTENDGKTTLTLSGGPLNATEAERKTFETSVPMVQQGFKGTFDQLAAYLESALNG